MRRPNPEETVAIIQAVSEALVELGMSNWEVNILLINETPGLGGQAYMAGQTKPEILRKALKAKLDKQDDGQCVVVDPTPSTSKH